MPTTVPSLIALTVLTALWLRVEMLHVEQRQHAETHARLLDEVLGEVTRMRVEQSADGMGPAALLEKLAVYAPLTSNAQVTEPDYQNARKELRAIVRAFEATGATDAWKPVVERIDAADVREDFDELKVLLDVAIRIDPEAGKEIAKEVLLGRRKPYPRLRWWAAELLIRYDKPLAQKLLHQVLMTESSRGVDIHRIGAYGAAVPDPTAYATTGFHNFVRLYLLSEDDAIDDTLIRLLGHVEQDKITLQECIKALGDRGVTRAVDAIKKLYDKPPLGQQDFFFLGYCAQAVAQIDGANAIPWLEEKLKESQIDVNARRLSEILDKLRNGEPLVPASSAPPPAEPGRPK